MKKVGVMRRASFNALEQQVWASVFAAEFSREWEFRVTHGKEPDRLSGFSCAEVADEAVEKLREALTCEDSKYLTPVTERWGRDL
jgi:hypothetical protein